MRLMHQKKMQSLLYSVVFIFIIGSYPSGYIYADQNQAYPTYGRTSPPSSQPIIRQKTIRSIIIEGNEYVPTAAIKQRVPYQIGDIFSPAKSAQLISSVYHFGDLPYDVGYFKHVRLETEDVDDDGINLYIVVAEKYQVGDIIFEGRSKISESEIKKKIVFEDIPVIDEDDLAKYANILKDIYREKNYHHVDVNAYITLEDNIATVHFDITEHKASMIKRVFFEGNCYFASRKLRSLIFTREDWILGFLDKAGTYQPDAIEADKFALENFYQSHGFLHAKVIDVDIDIDECNDIFVTFKIEEGEQYYISEVHAPGNDIMCEEDLLRLIRVKPGQLYSKERIRETIEDLRLVWGEHGHIYADIAPSIQPNEDEKTVEITFYTELGPCVYLNRINILGNYKTRDKVIRRQLNLREGELLTTQKMDVSKTNVELLGYFDARDGVNWRINRVEDDLADLDLIVKEIKTGRIEWNIGFGGSPTDIRSPQESLSVKMATHDTNLFGLGIHFDAEVEVSKKYRSFDVGIVDPWMFDRPIYGAAKAFLKRSTYEDFTLTQKEVVEQYRGGTLTAGYMAHWLGETRFVWELGVDGINYGKNSPQAQNSLAQNDKNEFQLILDKRFRSGTFVWFGTQALTDVRNHPMHPSRGYQWLVAAKTIIPSHTSDFGIFRADADASWYTPLIGERDLVLGLHAHAGFVKAIAGKAIPFRELYHIGGPASVRGYLFGEIGPTWRGTESIGATKAFWLNAELVFPLSGDLSMKGAVFYDGGAGWDTPDNSIITAANLKRNSFSYRHAVGFGLRLLRPTPVKLDWGFKLDRKKGEKAAEAHLTMYHNF